LYFYEGHPLQNGRRAGGHPSAFFIIPHLSAFCQEEICTNFCFLFFPKLCKMLKNKKTLDFLGSMMYNKYVIKRKREQTQNE
jgi:hypothetical protein